MEIMEVITNYPFHHPMHSIIRCECSIIFLPIKKWYESYYEDCYVFGDYSPLAPENTVDKSKKQKANWILSVKIHRLILTIILLMMVYYLESAGYHQNEH